jgi:histidine triad (HIT) family protein
MTVPDCLFCKIVRKEIPANEVLRDEYVVAFRDLNPQAPTHILVVPTVHADHLSDFALKADGPHLTRFLQAAAELGTRFGAGSYRVVMNEGPEAGQSVHHLHAHVLAGRRMSWPPG